MSSFSVNNHSNRGLIPKKNEIRNMNRDEVNELSGQILSSNFTPEAKFRALNSLSKDTRGKYESKHEVARALRTLADTVKDSAPNIQDLANKRADEIDSHTKQTSIAFPKSKEPESQENKELNEIIDGIENAYGPDCFCEHCRDLLERFDKPQLMFHHHSDVNKDRKIELRHVKVPLREGDNSYGVFFKILDDGEPLGNRYKLTDRCTNEEIIMYGLYRYDSRSSHTTVLRDTLYPYQDDGFYSVRRYQVDERRLS